LQKISKAATMRTDWKQDLRGSRNTIQGWRSVMKFLKRQPRKSQKRIQSRKSLKKSTSSQELPRTLTSPNQVKQIGGVCHEWSR
jgi:hypothetical protein